MTLLSKLLNLSNPHFLYPKNACENACLTGINGIILSVNLHNVCKALSTVPGTWQTLSKWQLYCYYFYYGKCQLMKIS